MIVFCITLNLKLAKVKLFKDASLEGQMRKNYFIDITHTSVFPKDRWMLPDLLPVS